MANCNKLPPPSYASLYPSSGRQGINNQTESTNSTTYNQKIMSKIIVEGYLNTGKCYACVSNKRKVDQPKALTEKQLNERVCTHITTGVVHAGPEILSKVMEKISQDANLHYVDEKNNMKPLHKANISEDQKLKYITDKECGFYKANQHIYYHNGDEAINFN